MTQLRETTEKSLKQISTVNNQEKVSTYKLKCQYDCDADKLAVSTTPTVSNCLKLKY